jgi:hypothetical protein
VAAPFGIGVTFHNWECKMLDLNDKRWTKMQGGYRVPFDPRLS